MGLLEEGGGAAVGHQPPQRPGAAADPPLAQPGDQDREVAVEEPGHGPGRAAAGGRRVVQGRPGHQPAGEAQPHVPGGQVGWRGPGGQGGGQRPGQGPGPALEHGRGGHVRAVAAEGLAGQLELGVQVGRAGGEQLAGGQPGHGPATSSRALRTLPKVAAWGRSGRSA
jgi:hypothetical protein